MSMVRPPNDFQWLIWLTRFRALQSENRRLKEDIQRLVTKVGYMELDVRAQSAIAHALARRQSYGVAQ